ncbi:peptidase domain-containing ABC transporter [Arsenicibacter rosenii]|uniref:ABC transporter ATP-binding protein n=1 Tax=Arsenicibacter rosenii TaxID=1750698 RepID=A0A1S2VG69_9BACT|nr:peptidase domain-containing ABC transporter [Arsenicibacter rosenii]OIN57712.1 ABC transporter ATP-binding protein [Arsenicibacter rosenii]
MAEFPHYRQPDAMDCGPTCLRMVAKHYGRSFSMPFLREKTEIGREGVSLLGIAQAAESIGFRTLAVRVSFERLDTEAPLPCIVHWGQNHFVVVYKIKQGKVYVADPGAGLLTYTRNEFESRWATTVTDGVRTGIALLLETTPVFFEDDDTGTSDRSSRAVQGRGRGWGILFGYLWQHKRLLLQLGLGLAVGSVLQLILPFLTQSIVDTGIQTRNLHFIYLVLAAQLALFVGRMAVEFIRSWILLHISTRINLSILSDFLIKLLKLPVSFFDTKLTGDILQRIGDHSRIEQFLTGTSLNTLFSVFNLVIYSVVAAMYNLAIFGVFVLSSVLYTAWILIFLRYRKQLDHKRFALASQNQSSLIQLVQGLPEIKLNNAEQLKRWEWENLQVKQFKLRMKGLAIGQYQQAGALFLNEGRNIIITFLSATAVVNGQMTLGGMLAMQYIIGQLNGPVEQLIGFIQHYQDAQISLERLNEIHEQADEEVAGAGTMAASTPRSITLHDLWFTYPGAGNDPVLKGINLHIPAGKVTAIVGTSGSGKTTLLKLLLKFYEPTKGEIYLTENQFQSPSPGFQERGQGGEVAVGLSDISHRAWRARCGTVLQDGFIFSDTIANNIAVSDETPDRQKLANAARVGNIHGFIESLPLKYNTKIGSDGSGISQGQRQRMLMARAVYKDPDYLFLDEATNALDANNERMILHNLAQFVNGKTVVVVAHRLSTVKQADQIVVLEQGEVVEVGTHAELTQRAGRYYELVRNQLELAD